MALKEMAYLLPILLFLASLLLCFYKVTSTTYNKLTLSNPLQDGKGTTLVSPAGTFELGFFTPGSTGKRYLGIWFRNIPDTKVVWVANRENSTTDNSTVLQISRDGNLVLIDANGGLLWSTSLTTKASNPVVQLHDNGNLILRDDDDNNKDKFLWQSFDYPSDTLLPGMKLSWDIKTGKTRSLTSWRNWDDPTPGSLFWTIMLTMDPELAIMNGSSILHRSGPWNGVGFKGALSQQESLYTQTLFNTSEEVSYMYNLTDNSVLFYTVVNQTESHRFRYLWVPETKTWKPYQSVPRDDCDVYDVCGPYGTCIANQITMCHCLRGFHPKSQRNWDSGNWTEGCVRNDTWSCKVKDKDGFNRFSGFKFPDTRNSWANEDMTLDDCNAKCTDNCSCTAYASLYVNGSGCIMWFGDLVDMRDMAGGQDLFIRMGVLWTSSKHRKMIILLAIAAALAAVLVLLLVIWCIYSATKGDTRKTMSLENGEEDFELPIFDMATMVEATNNFSDENKLGQGGYGPVYKGKLANGQEIAVKRLSRVSEQGINEFKSEVILCAKLQHRNLVKVIGCCVEGGEKMLVYEYMPNKSLDAFIFDSTRGRSLDWPKRFHIICSIARGLVYLHQDSILRIIHRDLKASNILLDINMNPKISDFGLARMCSGDQDEGNTNIVIGTCGYMAPEYINDGLFSTRSDVFSFGVLLLEIISGRKNKRFNYQGQTLTLIGHAWRLWGEGNTEKLIDENLSDSCVVSEVKRCIQIGLLCVQHNPDDRPPIASVAVMLSSNNTLKQPKEPDLVQEISIMLDVFSSDEMTVSLVNSI